MAILKPLNNWFPRDLLIQQLKIISESRSPRRTGIHRLLRGWLYKNEQKLMPPPSPSHRWYTIWDGPMSREEAVSKYTDWNAQAIFRNVNMLVRLPELDMRDVL